MSHAFPEPTSGPCKPWGVWATLLWGFAALLAWLAMQLLVGDVAARWFFGGSAGIDKLTTHAPFVSVVTIGAALVPLAVLAIAIRLRGCTLNDYLGLGLTPRVYLWIGIAALAVLIPVVDLVSWLAGYPVTPAFVVNVYRSALDTGTLLLLLLALVVAAPVVEEVLFRGFLLPSLAGSRLGAPGAILVTSAIWAAMHAQYPPFYLAQIVVLGVLLGWLRLASGSTAIPIVVHAVVNLIAFAQAALVVHWLN